MRLSSSISKALVLGVLVAGPYFTVSPLSIPAKEQIDFVTAEAACENDLRQARDEKNAKAEAQALQRLAILKAQQDQNTESEQLFRQALRLDGGNVTLLCDFAKYFSDRKQYRDAETVLKNGILIAPDHRRALYGLGTVIASQEDRHTEGLRYLKLALGEPLAYRELAKICQEAGKTEQAEHTLQRAALLEQAEPRPSSESLPEILKTPTVPMDDVTKKELVEHIRRELLRQESEEIAEEIAEMEKEPEPLQKLPSIASQTDKTEENTLNRISPTAQTTTVLTLPVISPKSEPSVMAKDEKPANDRLPRLVAPATETQDNVLPRIVSKQEKTKTEEPKAALAPLPRISSASDVSAAALPSPKPVNPAAPNFEKEQVKSEPAEKKREPLKTLPVAEQRISNSPDALASSESSGEIQPLPNPIQPMDENLRQGNLPKYAAMGIKRVPETQPDSPLPEPVKSDDRISLELQYPTSQTSLDKPFISQHREEFDGMSEPLAQKTAFAEEAKIPRLDVSDHIAMVPVVTDTPLIRLGSVKNRNQEEEPVMAEPEKTRTTLRTITREPVRKEPDPSDAAVSFRRTPPMEKYDSTATRRPLPNVEPEVPEVLEEPVATRLVEPEPVREERSELQFSSNRAPNVLRFEVSRNRGLREPLEPNREEPTADHQHVFHPPTKLKFMPNRETTEVAAETPASDQAQNRNIPIPEYPVLKQETRPPEIETTEHREIARNAEVVPPAVEPPQSVRAATHDPFVVVRETAAQPKPELRNIPSVEPVRVEPSPKTSTMVTMIPSPEPEPVPETAAWTAVESRHETPEVAMIEMTVPAFQPPAFQPPEMTSGGEELLVAESPAVKSETLTSSVTLQELSKQFAAPPVHESLQAAAQSNVEATDNEPDDSIGFATTRKAAALIRQPAEPVLETKTNSETKTSKAGFARSGRYAQPKSKRK